MKRLNNNFLHLLFILGFTLFTGCAPLTSTTLPIATSTPNELTPVIEPSFTPIVTEDSPILEITPTIFNLTLALPPVDEAANRLSVPEGFAIRIFARDLSGKPRFMAFGPDNQLYLSLTSAGEVIRLPDRDMDGLADSRESVINGLNQPHGLEWLGDWLYIAENDRIERFHFSTTAGVFDQRELVTDNIPGGGGHYTRTIHFGPDGKMYISAGSSCNVCVESDPRRAAILRFNPDGSIPADNPFANDPDVRMQAVWATGLRNSVDFLWTPTGEMWANTNGRDNLLDGNGLPDSMPPEVIVFPIRSGQFYGWPYCYSPILGFNDGSTPQIMDTQSGYTLPQGLDCAQAIPASFTDLSHSAPLGMTLGQQGNFPLEYQQDLFVAYHGSWNVQEPNEYRDCKITRIVIRDGQPVRSEDFVNGFRESGKTCGDRSSYGRPADVIFGPDGAMYISDDAAGRVYRVISIQ